MKIQSTTIGTLHHNLFFEKKVSISFDTCQFDQFSDYKVLVQIEPPSILNIEDQIIRDKKKFDLILTWNKKILANCENSELFPFGSCWIRENERKIHKKTKLISIIASNKQITDGHNLRHSIIRHHKKSLDVFGKRILSN